METRSRDITGQAKSIAQDTKEIIQESAQSAAQKAKTLGATAMASARNAYDTAQDKVVSGARVTDGAIRENPYAAIGIAFGVGVLIGFLARRK